MPMFQAHNSVFRPEARGSSNHPGALARSLESVHPCPVPNTVMGDLVDQLPVGIIVINTQGRVDYANSKAESIFSDSLMHKEWARVVASAIQPQPDDGCEVSLKSGLKVRVDTQPLPEKAGQMLVVTDLTQTRHMQARLSHNRRLSDLGKMVAALAHQIRTPVSTALLYTHQLHKVEAVARSHGHLIEKLERQLHSVEKQVRDMLTYSQVEQPMDDIIPMNLLPHLVIETVEDIAHSQSINLRCHSDIDRTITIRGNQELLINVLSNMVMNAIEASPAHSEIVVGVVASDSQVSFYVSDEGCGIPYDQITSVFEPFYTTKTTGTGLGLSIAKQVIEQHGGCLVAESELDVGSTLVATFNQLLNPQGNREYECECTAS